MVRETNNKDHHPTDAFILCLKRLFHTFECSQKVGKKQHTEMKDIKMTEKTLVGKCVWFTTDLYKNPFKRQFIKNAFLFGFGVWFAREFADMDIIAPAAPPIA